MMNLSSAAMSGMAARCDLALEGIQRRARLLLEADRDEYVKGQPEPLRVEQCHVLPNEAIRFQRLYARKAWRRREVDTLGQRNIRQTGVGLQFAQDAQVHGIKVHRACLSMSDRILCCDGAVSQTGSSTNLETGCIQWQLQGEQP